MSRGFFCSDSWVAALILLLQAKPTIVNTPFVDWFGNPVPPADFFGGLITLVAEETVFCILGSLTMMLIIGGRGVKDVKRGAFIFVFASVADLFAIIPLVLLPYDPVSSRDTIVGEVFMTGFFLSYFLQRKEKHDIQDSQKQSEPKDREA